MQSQRACHWHIPMSKMPCLPLHNSLGRVLLCGWAFHLGIWVCASTIWKANPQGYNMREWCWLAGLSPGHFIHVRPRS